MYCSLLHPVSCFFISMIFISMIFIGRANCLILVSDYPEDLFECSNLQITAVYISVDTLTSYCLRARHLGNSAKLYLTVIAFSVRRPFLAVCRLSSHDGKLLLRGNHLQHSELQCPHNVARLHVQLDVCLDHAQNNLAGSLCHSSLLCHRQTGQRRHR